MKCQTIFLTNTAENSNNITKSVVSITVSTEPEYLLEFVKSQNYIIFFKASLSYDPDIPCIHLIVFAQLDGVILTNRSSRKIKLNTVP